MPKKVLKATHAGNLKIGENIIRCAVLEDGTRVLTQADFLSSIGRARRYGGAKGVVTKLPPFLSATNLKPFIDKDLERSSPPIIFKRKAGGGYKGNSYGFRADLLPRVCEVFLRAKDAGSLKSTQSHIAEKCDILVRGLAQVGIIALVDEATGYQIVRDRQELQKILSAYISDSLLPWTTRFPMEFFREMFRLRGWKFSPIEYKKRGPRGPRYAGKLTKELIYQKLPDGVLGELEKKNPYKGKGRKYKHHQWLADDIGNPHLEKQVAVVTTLMKISPNGRTFKRHFERAFPIGPQQKGLFPDLEEIPVK